MSHAAQDAHLIKLAVAGDQASFATLAERSRDRIWRIIASVARGADVDDLAQEAILKAYSGLRHYRAEASFDAWLCRIAINVAHDYHRSAWKRKVCFWQNSADEFIESGECPVELAGKRDMQRRVRQAVAKLPESQRLPIWLHFFEQFSLAEIARLEDTPESTIRSRMKAGMQKIAVSLEDMLEGEPFGAPGYSERSAGVARHVPTDTLERQRI